MLFRQTKPRQTPVIYFRVIGSCVSDLMSLNVSFFFVSVGHITQQARLLSQITYGSISHDDIQ